MISVLAKLFRLLSSDIEPYQLSLGICLGIVIGLSPVWSPQTLICLILMMALRANISILFATVALVSIIAYVIDPLLESTGRLVLTAPAFNEMFTAMYNNGWWRFVSFNNTVTMGSLVISLVMFVPVFITCNVLIKKYRNVIEKYWKDSRVFTMLKSSKVLARIVGISEKIA